jgi:carboxypeptidase C (cathepsin A)
MRSSILKNCFVAGILALPAGIQTHQEPLVTATEHTRILNGQTVTYTATVAETIIAGPEGKPAGSMITTSYVRKGVQRGSERPVMFVFNGGPGASSSPLHMGAFGPRRIIDSAAGRSIVDNPYSPLDVVDLVFVDPIGTGYSRPLPGMDGRPFWSVSGDAASVKTFIRKWLRDNGRESSPRFLCGESYGATRAAQIVSSGNDLSFDGVLLFSMTGSPGGPDLPYVMLFPSYAVTAAFHKKAGDDGRAPAQVFADAVEFARTEYMPALLEGDSLAAGKAARLAEEMSRRIGLPASFIAERKLRVSRSDFMLNLLKDRGLRTGQIDARATGKIEDYAGKKGPYDDPSMFVGGSSAPTVHAYFTSELKFPATEPYKTLNLEINSRWKFDCERAMSDPAGIIGKAMKEQPRLRLFWAAGYYDLTTPFYAGKHALDHAGIPPARLVVAAFPTGHSVFEGDENLARFTGAVRSFIQGATRPEAQTAPVITVHIKPGALDENGSVNSVGIRIDLPATGAEAGTPVLQMPLVIANVDSVARTMRDFAASDPSGPLQFETRDDTGGAPLLYRRWIPQRAITGTLSLQYTAPITSAIPNRTGPPFALRTEGGGFSGAGAIFLLTPVDTRSYRVAIRWELGSLGPGASGTSSFGDGDLDAPAAPEGGLVTSFFMAGPLRRFPEEPSPNGFSSAWLGTPPFDAVELMAWSERLHTWYVGFFKGRGDQPYRVFLRLNPINPGGGVGLTNSFVATFDQTTRSDSLKLTLAHEMFHTFSPSLSGPDSQWFSEGLAIHYQRLLPWRVGMIDEQRFLDDLNATAARYFTNALNTTPNGQIAARFWEDTRIRVLPYDRGAMYLAKVDGSIRKASGGKRSLDDLTLALLDRQRQGLTSDESAWVELITRELGPSAKTEFESMLAGAVMVPDSDAFGPCFKRHMAPLRRFDLGFDPKIMNQETRIIRGLAPGSEAERAGLRNGDEIVNPVGLDGVQGDQKGTITMQIRREGKVFPVTYLPRGETMETWQWFLVPRCK